MAKTRSVSPMTDHQVARFVVDSAYQVWLAGLGAYARAGRQGSRLFDNLVALGERIEEGTRDRVDAQVRAAETRVQDVRDTAAEAWERLEALFQARVARALNSLQIPTARDVHELNRRVEELQKAVDRLARSPAAQPKAKTATRRKAAPKAGSRKAAARQPAARKKPSRKSG